jgi:hypothetical protein
MRDENLFGAGDAELLGNSGCNRARFACFEPEGLTI